MADAYAKLAKMPRKQHVREISLTFPKVFSFIENPAETIDAIEQTVQAIRRRPVRLLFDQRHCETVDLCAAGVINALVADAKRRQALRCSGILPMNAAAQEIVRATGLPHLLGVKEPALIARTYHRFPLREGTRVSAAGNPKDDDRTLASDITIYIDQCLSRINFELTSEGKERLAGLTAEVMENAGRHSGSDRWWICGYFHQKDDDRHGDCHITIFNLGQSIAENMQTLPTKSAIRTSIERLIAQHNKGGFWSFSDVWREDDLWTLYALQQGVSSRNRHAVGEKSADNGQGTIDLIRWFDDLGRLHDSKIPSKMTIVSGSTQIMFDGTYPLLDVILSNGQLQRQISFNEQRSLAFPPDRKAVCAIPRKFPGTVISMRFFFDQEFLLKQSKAGGQHVK